jgi:hypothetical protein
MATFILVWNPDKWSWPEAQLARAIKSISNGQVATEPWSFGVRRKGVSVATAAFSCDSAEAAA